MSHALHVSRVLHPQSKTAAIARLPRRTRAKAPMMRGGGSYQRISLLSIAGQVYAAICCTALLNKNSINSTRPRRGSQRDRLC
eukprot:363518-Chlamydomonas_euryale.AAC.11